MTSNDVGDLINRDASPPLSVSTPADADRADMRGSELLASPAEEKIIVPIGSS
jgi:hypothetical protein